MEELINDIENISINSNNADDLNNRDFDKSDITCEQEILPKANIEDFSIISLTPIKDSTGDDFRSCILCRDYSSPICKECSNNGSNFSGKNKQKNKIIPDGKVKALAKQFEDILPDGVNNCSNYSTLDCDYMIYNEELIKGQIYQSNDITQCVVDVNTQKIPDGDCESLDGRFERMKNILTPIIDPDLCEKIDPIKAIITSSSYSNDNIAQSKSTENKSADPQLILIQGEPNNVLKNNTKENDVIFDTFESLSPLEQRTLLLQWITDTLKRTNSSSEIPEDEVQEVIQILKGIVNELECGEFYKESCNSVNKGTILLNPTQFCSPHNIGSDQTSFSADLSRKMHQRTSLVNSRLQINIGIPEDEEIEEDRINELIIKNSKNISCDLESYSLIMDEVSLSPKSDIGSGEEELVESSIKEIGNHFFGFFE
ncbi:C2C2 zinc ribbon-containing protein [Cryptosporidium canis]|uniref:C2C2 zinc ribbon-containing protein n=1 Tax=Cryptosporidium canis TaxID=195482 RepID=A0ABQ8P6Y6_9CRYT|nr:C2C2 zinc ribbon-containing protein [Cryptosporidium canis]KAJ1614432.1 C2C2 zinc ribbon-containing protein [Cryptosporidium canis]